MDATYKVAFGPALHAKIPPGDERWREFNGSFVNQEATQLGIAGKLYDGHPITTWHEPQWRKSDNYKYGQHIGLDFDTGDKRSAIAHLMKEPFVTKYGAIIYTTPSHTPDKPRTRAIFLLDTPIHQAKNYVLATTALLWVFGSADRQCKDPARFFYGGKPGACEMEWLSHELPLDVVKDLIARYQQSGARERKRVGLKYQPGNADEQDIMNALKVIDPWGITYDQWLAVLMGIHSEMPGDRGLALAEQWADGRNGEVEDKWRGFRQLGNTQGRVSVGTLFALAKERGWERARGGAR